MWMMDCSNGCELNMSDSFNGRKLRPLIPRPTTACPPNTINSAITIPSFISCIHGTDPLQLATVTEQTKKDFNTQSPLVSSRWNPTPEQLQALEEMYRCGTRTPSAEQIQHIAAQLRCFGKIEGKNVFYWFQNHKARDRQKRRRQLGSAPEEYQSEIESPERKESGLRRTGFEVEQKKNWVPPSNCSRLAEESVSIHRAAVAESRSTDGWIQFEERELQQRGRSIVERHATRQMMQLCSSSPPTTHLINNITTTTAAEALQMIDSKLLNTQNPSILLTTNRENFINPEDESRESQTLQLFPLPGDDRNAINVTEKDPKVPITTINTNFTPNQFFEFLPLRN